MVQDLSNDFQNIRAEIKIAGKEMKIVTLTCFCVWVMSLLFTKLLNTSPPVMDDENLQTFFVDCVTTIRTVSIVLVPMYLAMFLGPIKISLREKVLTVIGVQIAMYYCSIFSVQSSIQYPLIHLLSVSFIVTLWTLITWTEHKKGMKEETKTSSH